MRAQSEHRLCRTSHSCQYWAKVGGGAFKNGVRLGQRPQHLKDLSSCSVCLQCKSACHDTESSLIEVLTCSGGSGRRPNIMEPKYANAKKLYSGLDQGGKEVHAIRMIGSSTGALACLASGQIDIFQFVPLLLQTLIVSSAHYSRHCRS